MLESNLPVEDDLESDLGDDGAKAIGEALPKVPDVERIALWHSSS